MSVTIRIDDEVYARLKKEAEAFEAPNTTLRRLLGMTPDESVEDLPAEADDLAALLGLTEAKSTKKGPFYLRLPQISPRTVRHNKDREFALLVKAVHELIRGKFGARFTAVVHAGSVSWLEGTLCNFKLNFHGKEGLFVDETARLKCVFGVRQELVDQNPRLGTLDVWDRRFQVPPDWAAMFVGFEIDNERESVDRVRKVIDGIK